MFVHSAGMLFSMKKIKAKLQKQNKDLSCMQNSNTSGALVKKRIIIFKSEHQTE